MDRLLLLSGLSYAEIPLTLLLTAKYASLCTARALCGCAALYLWKECYCMSVCLHRYFSHRAFRCSRAVQFGLSFVGCLASQGAPLWWASKHRRHHSHCDTEKDPHSPQAFSKLYAWLGWIYAEGPFGRGTDAELVQDLLAFPELYLFEIAPFLPVCLVHYAVYSLYGLGALVFASMWSSVLCQLLTLYFNVLFHSAPSSEGTFSDTCRAIDNPYDPLSNLFGEAYHKDHHRHPARCKRPGIDLPYWSCIMPLKRAGVFV